MNRSERALRPTGLVWAALMLILPAIACGGPLAHVQTDAKWLDPVTGRASAPLNAAPSSGEPLRIAVYGDVRGGRAKHRAVVAAIRTSRPDLVIFTGDALRCLPVAHMPDFGLATYALPFWPQYVRGYPWVSLLSIVPFPGIVHETLGGTIAPPRDADGWNGFLEDTAPIRLDDRTPYVFVPGNHDLYHHADRREVFRLFRLDERTDRNEDELYQSVDLAGYRLHALDTGDDLLGDSDPTSTGKRQLAWLNASLAEAESKGLRSIVAMHLPPYSSGAEDEPSPNVRERVARDILDRHEVALVLAGHSHAYERIVRAGHGGKDVTHIITGGGGAPFHHEVDREERDPGSKVFVEAVTHFVSLELLPNEIRGRMVAVEGRGSDEFVAR
jgi:Icc-related predicted phosphoesterase